MATYDDPRILRAIAHPTRNRILAELAALGASRAADLAQTLEIPANQASFHLRQLAKYGLVEEAPEEARDRRDRVWRLAGDQEVTIRAQDITSQPGGRAAMEVYRRSASARGHALVEAAYAEPVEGVERVISEDAIRLTGAEALELSQELREVVLRWRRHGATGDGRSGEETAEQRTTYSLYQLLQPYPEVFADVAEPVRIRGFGGA